MSEESVPALPLEKEAQTMVEPQPMQQVVSINGTDPVLAAARDELAHGELSSALHAYSHLIRRGRLLDEMLPDLARLAQVYPRDPEVLETLGDALARAGRSEQATQSYEQARKLRQ